MHGSHSSPFGVGTYEDCRLVNGVVRIHHIARQKRTVKDTFVSPCTSIAKRIYPVKYQMERYETQYHIHRYFRLIGIIFQVKFIRMESAFSYPILMIPVLGFYKNRCGTSNPFVLNGDFIWMRIRCAME